MNIVDFGEFSKKRSDKHDIDWLREEKRDLQKNYKQMFDIYNPDFGRLWQLYVDIEEKIENRGLPPIGLPYEIDYPGTYIYWLDHLTENYTEWHKREFNKFCEMMEKTIEMIE